MLGREAGSRGRSRPAGRAPGVCADRGKCFALIPGNAWPDLQGACPERISSGRRSTEGARLSTWEDVTSYRLKLLSDRSTPVKRRRLCVVGQFKIRGRSEK